MQKRVISLFWRSAMRYPFRTSMALIGSAAAAVIGGYAGPFFIAQLLEKLQAGDVTIDSSMSLIILYIITQIYGQIISWRLNLYFTWTMQTAGQRDLYGQIFSKLTEQSLSFHADRFGGALVSQTTKLIGAFERFWDTIIFQLVPTVSSVLAAVIILGLIFWQYAVVLLILSLIFMIAVLLGSKLLAVRNREEAQASTATNAYVADAVTNIMTIKAHGREAEELATLTGRANTWRQKSLSSMRGFLALSTGYSTLNAMTNIAALIAAIWASEHHIISIGTVYLSITYTLIVARQLWEMNSIMRNYNRIMGDAHDMAEILNTQPAVVDKSTTPLIVDKGAITFDNVTFTHAGDGEPLFDGFTLHVKPGDRIGLVGRSGSGKTTLTRLLLRFADIEKGQIMIDDQNIADVSQKSLRRSIAYVPQEPMLFHRTLRENIGYGNPSATDEQIIKAAKQANALEFIEKLPKKFDTMVGERGVKLSGGQRQRIAIARAILMDAPILVLDEATSALDSESERLIQQALRTLMKGRTAIVIAHRLSTVQKMDRIIVLENGTINEEGSHAELLTKKGIYADLWRHQSGGFIEA
jgi:ATP-binding cassette subfamily B protein